MRVSRAQAEVNRDRVIDVASRLFRQHGFDGIGLKDLMAAAGLTQGGFYKQFTSKEDLAANACTRGYAAVRERWREFAAGDPQRPLEALVRAYLSCEHRDEQAEGCVMAALGPDAARAGPAIRTAMEEGVVAYVDFIEAYLPNAASDRHGRAMAIASTMIGAIVLSRSVNDPALSKEILDASVRDILERSGAPKSDDGRE
ncbi:TetR/AcrR family transcriptional regulator [Aureimonas frigidaquae]|uniref:Transcriptional regulator n=1 Tax=Aureimonas frigidaquae TaxID=424757 RepID=A0A0P0Z428_9HYPH|nr:TetR/AcrR family transcriptional regulator [Aureimonas frigidaquae]BAT28773.1 transcriptional regulator [Aureimonas frigidaquae]